MRGMLQSIQTRGLTLQSHQVRMRPKPEIPVRQLQVQQQEEGKLKNPYRENAPNETPVL